MHHACGGGDCLSSQLLTSSTYFELGALEPSFFNLNGVKCLHRSVEEGVSQLQINDRALQALDTQYGGS